MIITEVAQKKVAEIIKAPIEVMPSHKFFLRVTAIEDNGLKYQTYFDFESRHDDIVFNFKEFDLKIDKESLNYLESMSLDYNEQTGFSISTI